MTADPNVAPGSRCEVCEAVEADPRLLQRCFTCDAAFHLNPRADADGRDCGDAWIGSSLGVEYYCQRCIDERQRDALEAHGGDPARARQQELMSMITPGLAPPPAAAPPPATPRRAAAGDSEAPPRPARPRNPRRYRRIDR